MMDGGSGLPIAENTSSTVAEVYMLDFRQPSVIANSLSSRVLGFNKSRAKEGLQRFRSRL